MIKKTIALLQSNYIPWKGYFDMIAKSNVFVIYDEVQFTKNDWRNRNKIKSSTGLEWITIPVKVKSLHQKISETEIAQNNWKKKHLGTLQANYGKAPFYKESMPLIDELYEINSTLISEINQHMIIAICNYLDIPTQIIRSETLNLQGNKEERIIDACEKLQATHYLSGTSAKSYINIENFQEKHLVIDWMNYSNYKEYSQLHTPFEHGVSILDLIFNKGKASKDFMKYVNK
jgi:hypothetical protein